MDIDKTIAEIEASLGEALSVDMTPAELLVLVKAELEVLKSTEGDAATARAEAIIAFVEEYRQKNYADTATVSVPVHTGAFAPQTQTAWKEYSSKFVQPVIGGAGVGNSGGVDMGFADTKNVPAGGAGLGTSGQTVQPEIAKSVTFAQVVDVFGKVSVQVHELLGKEAPADLVQPAKPDDVGKAASGAPEKDNRIRKSADVGWTWNLNSPEFRDGRVPDPLDDFSQP